MSFEKIKKEAIESFKETFKTSEIGSDLLCLETIDSTNLHALRNHSSLNDGTVILADSQTAGRGRKGRTWSSPPGLGLYMTVLLKRYFKPEQRIFLNLIASISSYEAVMKEIAGSQGNVGCRLELKWPNDLSLSGLKLGGVLSEGNFEQNRCSVIALGIGINLNHEINEFPPEIRERAISLKIYDHRQREPWEMARSITQNINHWFRMKPDDIIRAWSSHSPMVKGERVKVTSENEEFWATTEGLDSNGFLMVRRYGDRLQRILSADIFSIRKA